MLALDVTLRLDAFALEVQTEVRPRVSGLIGLSGAGKSTLLHAIAGLVRPDTGRILLGERVLLDRGRRIDVPPPRRRVGVVFQDARLFPHYTVAGNLRYGLRAAAAAPAGPGFDEIVDLLGLRPLLRRRPGRLSGGERQRVALGRALLSRPELLLLDEPLTGLDRAMRGQVLPYLAAVRDTLDVPIVYVSHDLSEVLQLTDHLLVMDRGRLVGAGRYGDLVQQGAVAEVVRQCGLLNVIRLAPDPDAPEGMMAVAGKGPPRWIRVPGPTAGRPIAVAVNASDIALAPHRIEGISIQNQLPGRVTRLSESAGRVIVEIDVGQPVLAEITPAARDQMDIAPQRDVWCLLKSTALRRLASSAAPPGTDGGQLGEGALR